MTAAVLELQQAIQALYGSDTELRRVADAHLKAARSREGFWVVALQLLTAQGASPHDQFFAAHALRTAAQRAKDLVAPEEGRALAAELGRLTLAAAAGRHWAIAKQLAGALAELAIRAPWWGVGSIVADVLQLLGSAQLLQPSQLQGQAQGQGSPINEAQLQAVLLVLAALPEACLSCDISVHPERRAAAAAVLASCWEVACTVELSLVLQASPGCQAAALQLMQAWAALPGAAAALQLPLSILKGLHEAVLHSPGLATEAAGAVAALYGACSVPGSPPAQALLQGLLPHLAGTVSGTLQAAVQQVQQAQYGTQLLNAAATILSAAGAALATQLCAAAGCALPGGGGAVAGQRQGLEEAGALRGCCLQPQEAAAAAAGTEREEVLWAGWWEALASVVSSLLELLQHPDPNVVLSALQPWDDALLPALQLLAAQPAQGGLQAPQRQEQLLGQGGEQNLGSDVGQDRQQQQQQRGQQWQVAFTQRAQQLLECFCGALLQRMALPESIGRSQATADARDLPESVRMVRRELSDTFRAAAAALGTAQAVQRLLGLAEQAQASWEAGRDPSQGWQQLECSLYALNLVLPKHAAAGGGAAQHATRQALRHCLAAIQPGAPKLAGTALTLLGGLAEALAGLRGESGPLPQLLEGLLELLERPEDPKLSRNAATAVQRLCSHPRVAAHLAAEHPAWALRLAALYCGRGGLQQAPRGGEDLTTEEFMLRALCHLSLASACTAGVPAGAGDAGMQGLLPKLIRQAASKAGAALIQLQAWEGEVHAAAGPGAANVLLPPAVATTAQQCGVQLEAIAVMLGSAAPPGVAQRLVNPGELFLLEEVWVVVQGAVQLLVPLGAQPQQLQQQMVPLLAGCCAAVAAAARAAPLQPVLRSALLLLQPLAAHPGHPCILEALAELASSAALAAAPLAGATDNPAAKQQMQGVDAEAQELLPVLAQTLGTAIQGADSHTEDPEWSVPVLGLCTQAARQPAILAAGGLLLLRQLLSAAQRGAQSYHREVCEAALQLAVALCCGAGTLEADAEVAAAGPAVAAAGAAACGQPGTVQPKALGGAPAVAQQRLVGPWVTLWLLLAASGGMPPYMMLPIAEALHMVWREVGSDRYRQWIGCAVLELAPAGAPWRSWKPEALHAALADLLSQQSMQDEKRFKRQLKVLCGGKKKGRQVAPPARGL